MSKNILKYFKVKTVNIYIYDKTVKTMEMATPKYLNNTFHFKDNVIVRKCFKEI